MSNSESMSSLTIALRLTIICIVAVILLIGANALTEEKIKDNSEIEEEKANKILFSGAADFDKMIFNSLDDNNKKSFYYFIAKDINQSKLGYVVYTLGGGYGGSMKIGFSVNTDLKILKVKLMDNSETPGFGKKYEKEKNVKLFSGTNTADKPIPYNLITLSQEDKDTVTSATISYKGIAESLIKGIDLLKKENK